MKKLPPTLLLALLLWLPLSSLHAVECGADRLEQLLPLLQERRVGLIVNHTSLVGSEQVHLLDTLCNLGVNVRTVFAPEHGFRGDADAGEVVAHGKDSRTGIPLVSLYGRNKRPTRAMLADIDVVVFDIQDVGARFYTYISTMYYAMQACASYGIPFIVLDRPNPNDYVDGAMLDPKLRSFVGALPLPILHGLTVGELALMINGEGWVGDVEAQLTVIGVKGWRHGEPYSLPVKPSPNLPNDQAIALYPSLCLFEATQVSVGRGTPHPFQQLGYPDESYGVHTFTPKEMVGFDKNPLQKGRVCYGLDLRQVESPKGFSLAYFMEFMQQSDKGAAFITRPDFFDLLVGDTRVRELLVAGASEEEIKALWREELEAYRAMRKGYLLYPDCH